MTRTEIEVLESYIKSADEYLNGFCFQILRELVTQQLFENLELPLKLFTEAAGYLPATSETPLLAVQMLEDRSAEEKVTSIQKEFVYRWVYKYLNDSVFDNDVTQVSQLIKTTLSKLREENIPQKPLVANMRTTLKEMIEKEISLLPESLNKLDNVQRLQVICKLIPFVLPKIDSIHHEKGEVPK